MVTIYMKYYLERDALYNLKLQPLARRSEAEIPLAAKHQRGNSEPFFKIEYPISNNL